MATSMKFESPASNRSAAWITAEYNNQNSPGTFITMGSESLRIVNAHSNSYALLLVQRLRLVWWRRMDLMRGAGRW